ncbi:MAG: helix-turn-helix domain-containing protein [Gemmatimonadaceae bacterium]|jgi:AraC-like DNA-binding protein|nr:helix-turn-helix domain-containing protein [Gemmatimonadaceae bacterium]
MLLPDERSLVDAAGRGYYESRHVESVDELLRTLREGGADAVVMSLSRCIPRETLGVARMVREFPRVPTVALLMTDLPRVPEAVLSLGHTGVRRIVDVRRPHGWQELRVLISSERGMGIERVAIARVREVLEGAPDELFEFFDRIFVAPPRVSTVQQLARYLHTGAGMLMSRFFRSRLPAPKRYLSMARLVRAAHYFENPGYSVTSVANALEYSSPQAFGRHVRAMVGVSASTFRHTTSGEKMLSLFLDELVWPHREVLRTFRPLGGVRPGPDAVEAAPRGRGRYGAT